MYIIHTAGMFLYVGKEFCVIGIFGTQPLPITQFISLPKEVEEFLLSFVK